MNELRALLQTDIVDSTRLAERLGDEAMSALWAAQDRAARDLLQRWRGIEIDKSDGFLLMFDEVADAVGYALAYRGALATLSEPLLARTGVHVGPVIIRKNAPDDVRRGAKPLELDGIAKAVAARVMSIALGGQTLLTPEARAALGNTERRVQSHGHWRLKGIEAPIELFEVGDDDAPFMPPPDSTKAYRVVQRQGLWLPVREVRHSLPAERDLFVGRREALLELARRFDAEGTRLVSVLGTGGTGKTRFVQRFAWTWLGDYPGGVWFCDLSQATSLDGIVHSVGLGLDVPLSGADPVTQLGNAIAGRGACLVILDNFEQVASLAAATLGQWLDRAGEATFLVTTREVLGIPGEEVMSLAPLDEAEGVALFRARAAAGTRVQASPEVAQALVSLVKLLDGLPLAIELAAARAHAMSIPTLLSRMKDRFKLLRSSGNRSDRHSTLRAAIDWSWGLLSQAEKLALAELSVFEGGFTLGSAEAVLDLSSCHPSAWIPNVVQSLADKSLVQVTAVDRFGLLTSVQTYAAEQLILFSQHLDLGNALVLSSFGRHWRYFGALSEIDIITNRCAESENLVIACRRATQAGDIDGAVKTLATAWVALKLKGPYGIAIDLARDVLAISSLEIAQAANANWVAGCAYNMHGDMIEAQERFNSGLGFANISGDRLAQVRIHCAIGDQLINMGRLDEAQYHLVSALSGANELGIASLQCQAMNAMGAVLAGASRGDEAMAMLQRALHIARQAADVRWEAGILGNLGNLSLTNGAVGDARDYFELAVAASRHVGDRRWEGNNRCNLGMALFEQGRLSEAMVELRLSQTIAVELGHMRLQATALCNISLVLEAQLNLDSAIEYCEKAVQIVNLLGDPLAEGQYRGYLGLMYAKTFRCVDSSSSFLIGQRLLEGIDADESLALLMCRWAAAGHYIGDVDLIRDLSIWLKNYRQTHSLREESELACNIHRIELLLGLN